MADSRFITAVNLMERLESFQESGIRSFHPELDVEICGAERVDDNTIRFIGCASNEAILVNHEHLMRIEIPNNPEGD